jgi:TldD protein
MHDPTFDPFALDRRRLLQLGAAVTAGAIAHPLFAANGASSSGPAAGRPTPPETGAPFGIPPEDLRAVLAVAMGRGGDFADLYFERTRSLQLVCEDDKISRAATSADLGMGVRVVKGDTVGYAFTEVLDLKAMKQAASTAAAIAQGKPGVVPQAIALAKLPRFYDPEIRHGAVAVEAKRNLVLGVNEALRKKDARIVKTVVTYTDSDHEIYVVTSEGLSFHDHQPMSRLIASCVAEQAGRRETGLYNIATRKDFSVYTPQALQRLVSEAVRRTVMMFDAVTPKGGEMPVVLGAGPSGILLHEAIGHGMEADFNRKNTSVYASKMGKAIAEPFVTIVDDGTLTDARGSIHVDDEGSASQKTVLVDNGKLASYLHDRISAKHYGVAPTGNGRRESFRHVPMPRMRSTYMEKGPHSRDEIVQSVKKGLYCESFSNGQVNIGGGDFTFFLKTGWLIEDGKLTRPVKDVNLIGNGPEVLTRISMVADDLTIDEGGWTCGKNAQSVPVSQGMPTVLVKAITVGGAA